MVRYNNNDALLIGIYLELESVLKKYSFECAIMEKAECSISDVAHIQAAQLRQESMAVQWHLALRRMTQLVPPTRRGSFAKNCALQLCFKHHLGEDEDVMNLAKSHIADLNRLLHDDGELAAPELRLVISEQGSFLSTD